MGRWVKPDSETVFLVSGGAKGITAACVIALAERFHSGFVLVGRSRFEPDAEPAWAMNVAGEAGLIQAAIAEVAATGERPAPRRLRAMVREVQSRREIQETLASIESAGGRAFYASADVTDRAGLERAVSEGSAALGPITGLIHGAGVLADKLVQDKPLADFEQVISVKVDGLRNMLACVPLSQLSFVVLFSSVAGFYGNTGQADYAVANEMLNKIAHWLRCEVPDCRVLAMNWGPWEGGMVTPALRKQLAERGVAMIPVVGGTALLADLLSAEGLCLPSGGAEDAGSLDSRVDESKQQIVVGSAIRPAATGVYPERLQERGWRMRRRLSLPANPFLRDHVIGGHAVLPTVCAVGWMANACEQVLPGYRYLRVDDYRALNGIVFDDSLSESYLLELRPVRSGGDEMDRIALDALISSEKGKGLPRYHYRARVTLVPDARRSRGLESKVDDVMLGAVETAGIDGADPLMDGAELYRDGTLFHGPSFRGIEAVVAMDETGLTMRCRVPTLDWTTQGQFPVQTFNPYAADVQLQSLLVWAHHHVGHGGLPLRIGWGRQVRPIPPGAVSIARMGVRTCTARSLVADVDVFDAKGRLCMQVGEAEITLSERLNALFAQNTLAVPARVSEGEDA